MYILFFFNRNNGTVADSFGFSTWLGNNMTIVLIRLKLLQLFVFHDYKLLAHLIRFVIFYPILSIDLIKPYFNKHILRINMT